MATVIYVRGDGISRKYPWMYAHPRTSRSDTELVLFDYVRGKKERWRNWNGALPPQTSADEKIKLRKGVHDLYDHIKEVGRLKPGSIIELHFFTHSHGGGIPVLLDTNEEEGTPSGRRDPADLDPRLKDFKIATVLGGAQGQNFRKAFARSALVKLWGCSSEGYFQRTIIDFYKLAKLKDTTKRQERQKRAKKRHQTQIKDLVFSYALSKLLGFSVYGSPAGWGTNALPQGYSGKVAVELKKSGRAKYVGNWPPRKGEVWWSVSAYFHPMKGYDFYKNILNASFDPVGYVAYSDALLSASIDAYPGDDQETAMAMLNYPKEYFSDYPDLVSYAAARLT